MPESFKAKDKMVTRYITGIYARIICTLILRTFLFLTLTTSSKFLIYIIISGLPYTNVAYSIPRYLRHILHNNAFMQNAHAINYNYYGPIYP